eukprot:evm.model.scf_1303.3 EVM.evm.TU.scf_1303.3   scf_1303:13177-14042(+)
MNTGDPLTEEDCWGSAQDWWLDVFRRGRTDMEPELMKCLSCSRVVLATRFGCHTCEAWPRKARGRSSEVGRGAQGVRQGRRRDRGMKLEPHVEGRRQVGGMKRGRAEIGLEGGCARRRERGGPVVVGKDPICGIKAEVGVGDDGVMRREYGGPIAKKARGMKEGGDEGPLAFAGGKNGGRDCGWIVGKGSWMPASGAGFERRPSFERQGCSEASASKGGERPDEDSGLMPPCLELRAPARGLALGDACGLKEEEGRAGGDWLSRWDHLMNEDGALVFPRGARRRRTSR